MRLRGYKLTYDRLHAWIFESDIQSPVIITVPHDGLPHHALSGFLEVRKNGIIGSDGHTWEIVKDTLLKVKVHAVRGMMPRHFLDYNRSTDGNNLNPDSAKNSETAFEDETMQPYYDYYHESIARMIKLMTRIYGVEGCLLIDFHGFTHQPEHGEFDIIIGTGNRTTVNSNVDRKLAAFLTEKGYRVFLPDENSEHCQYSGGYTVRHYAKKFGINAILVEVAQKFRTLEGRELGIKLSADFAEFLKLHFSL
jgi:N-formylglutamate amidohydrolase